MKIDSSLRKVRELPLRVRLTLWYLLLLGLAISAFGVYQYFQLQRTLLAAVDNSLNLASSQARANLDMEDGQLAFENTENWAPASGVLVRSDFAIQVLSPDGTLLAQVGTTDLTLAHAPDIPGYATIASGIDNAWRVYTQPLYSGNGDSIGWLLAVQSLGAVDETLENTRLQLLIGLLLVLLLAGSGGMFLADRALHPIDQITRTAQSIGASDLSQRIKYQGPEDEVGHLARTFDGMLSRLQTAFERERRFTGDAAHELRTPLTALKGQIEVAVSRLRRPREYRSTLENLLEQVNRLIRLSNALLFLSRVEQRQMIWETAPVDLTELLTVLIEQIRPLAEEKRLSIEAEIAPGLFTSGDADQLVRLFLNLLDNAIKFTPEEGEISLQSRSAVGGVEIALHNSGPGIPPEHLEHLFERFYRVDNVRARASGGAGLGLAIAYEIVRFHHGQIVVNSVQGQGLEVTVTLPSDQDKGR